jgi:parallel beta-helix repeat protein
VLGELPSTRVMRAHLVSFSLAVVAGCSSGCSSGVDDEGAEERDDAVADDRADGETGSARADTDADVPGIDGAHEEDGGNRDVAVGDDGGRGSGDDARSTDGSPLPGYYVDPLTGSMSNPGTAAKPWRTLEEVFAAHKTFAPGDHIYLRRGYHGGPIITGSNAAMVTILAEPGHSPIMKWVKFSGAKNWTLQDVFIDPEAAPADGQGTLIEFLATSTDNVVRNVGAYSTQDPYGWRADEGAWLAKQKTGMDIKSGGNNRIDGVHFLNVGNGMIVGSSGNVIEHTTLENFTRDGWVPLASNNTWQYDVVMNAIMTDHTISIFSKSPERLHRDMVQTWNGAKTGMVFRGNVMIAAADPTLPVAGNEPTATGYIDKRIPVFAGWDGPFTDYTFENNVIFTDHQAGIWLNNATRCRVVNNTVISIVGPVSSGFPAIKILGASSGNLVYNNIANGFDMPASALAGSGSNLAAPSYATTFLAPMQPMADARLKSTATAAIDDANGAHAPSLDADGNPRSATAGDIGAYEYGVFTAADTFPPSTPGAPRVVVVAGLGADLSWAPSTDNRAVRGYDVYRNGTKVGRSRNGARFFDLCATAESASYTVVAFDMSGNRSGASPATAAAPH